MTLISSYFLAFRDVLRPRMLLYLMMPFATALLVWGFITWLIWDWIVSLGFNLYNWGLMQKLVNFLSPYFTMTQDPLVSVTVGAFIVVVIVPAAVITAMIITSVFVVPLMVNELRRTEFTQIPKMSNPIKASVVVSIMYSVKYLFTWIVSLPLWFVIPGGAFMIPFLLLAWFNSRLFTWEVMMEIASPSETQMFLKKKSKSLFALGLMTSVLYYVPVLNLAAPVIVSAVFVRYCLKMRTLA